MEKIFINYEILDEVFTVSLLSYHKNYKEGIEYQEKVYTIKDYKDTNKNLYNDILNDFDLDFRFENDKFYEMLSIICGNIIKEIKEENR